MDKAQRYLSQWCRSSSLVNWRIFMTASWASTVCAEPRISKIAGLKDYLLLRLKDLGFFILTEFS